MKKNTTFRGFLMKKRVFISTYIYKSMKYKCCENVVKCCILHNIFTTTQHGEKRQNNKNTTKHNISQQKLAKTQHFTTFSQHWQEIENKEYKRIKSIKKG